MAIPRSEFGSIVFLHPTSLLTEDQRWAANFKNTMFFSGCISIVATMVSMVGFALTNDHGLPEAQKNGKVKKFAHRFFTCTLALGASAAAASFLGAGYAMYTYNKI